GAGQQGFEAVLQHGLSYERVVGGHHHAAGLRTGRLGGGAYHHGLAADIEQGLAGQAWRGRARRTAGTEAHAFAWVLAGGVFLAGSAGSSRASLSSMTGIPSRMGKASLSARQISSCCSRSWRKEPLHKGQTRISSRRDSMHGSRNRNE